MALTLTKASDLKLTDPRVRKTCLRALDWLGELSTWKEPKMISATTIRKELGNTSKGIGKMLRGCLYQHGSYSKATGKSYKYSVNEEAFARLEAKLGVKWDFLAWVREKGYTFNVAPPPRADQNRTGNRVYPWWATMRKDRRFELFIAEHGQCYDYDIEVAKPALTLQAWQKWMAEANPSLNASLPTWEAYVSNRTAFRQRLMDDLSITKEQAKTICQDVLNSAIATMHPKNGLYQRLGHAKTAALIEHPLYQGLAADFATYWEHIKVLNDLKLTAGTFVSETYNALEWQVMNVIEASLEQPGWFVHDGFMTRHPIDLDAIQKAVKTATGYDIRLSLTLVAA